MSRVYRNEKPVVDVNQWIRNPNGSIFIKYIPNYISKTNLRQMFDFLGTISRIDIVNIADGGTGRRAFIHFSDWKANADSEDMRNLIAKNYPLHTIVNIDSFEYSITLNSRPIPSTELNTQQLSDWSQRLNDEFVDFKRAMTEENEALKKETVRLTTLVGDLYEKMNSMFYHTNGLDAKIAHLEYDNASLRELLFEAYCTKYAEDEATYENMEQNMPSDVQGLTVAEVNLMDELAEEIERDNDRTYGDEQCDENNMDEIQNELDTYVIHVFEQDELFDIESGLGKLSLSRSISVN
jgi:hypothetical protein